MRTFSRYDVFLLETIIRLHQDNKVNDPAFTEIACAAFGKAPPAHPLTWPDELGGEVINGIVKRGPRLRAALAERGYVTAPLSAHYYRMDVRQQARIKPELALLCLPTRDNPPSGIRIGVPGKEDPIIQAHLRAEGDRGATRLDNTGKQVLSAGKSGVISKESARDMAAHQAALLQNSPAVVSKALNGGNSPKQI